jgi:hypothetical protein
MMPTPAGVGVKGGGLTGDSDAAFALRWAEESQEDLGLCLLLLLFHWLHLVVLLLLRWLCASLVQQLVWQLWRTSQHHWLLWHLWVLLYW